MNAQSLAVPQTAGRISAKVVLAVFLVLLAVAPRVLPEFYVTLLNYVGLSALVALGLVLLTGVGGLTSFGQAAFVGLGAYTTAVLTAAPELPEWLAFLGGSAWLALVAGLALTAVVAVILGSLTLRLSGHYLPLGTMAWGISLYFLFGNLEFLGGHSGMSGIPPISLIGYELVVAVMGADPIQVMAEIMMDESADRGLRGKMASNLAEFVFPKRKAVEHEGGTDNQLTIEIRRFSVTKDGVKDA